MMNDELDCYQISIIVFNINSIAVGFSPPYKCPIHTAVAKT